MDAVLEEKPKRKKNTIFHNSSRKPPAIRNEVAARRIAGQSKAKIARDLSMSVNTVSSIIELSDVDRLFSDGRIGTMQRVPEALKTLDVRLEKNSESAALWLLDKCFENQQPTGKRMASDLTLNQTLNVLLRTDQAPAETTQTIEVKPVLSDTDKDK